MSHAQHRQPDLGSLPPADFQLDLGTRIGVVNAVAPNTSHHVTLEELAGWIDEHFLDTDAFTTDPHNHDAADIVSGFLDDARISESSVTQHEAAIDHDALLNFDALEHFLDAPFLDTAGTRAMTGILDVVGDGTGSGIRGPSSEGLIFTSRESNTSGASAFTLNCGTALDTVSGSIFNLTNNNLGVYGVSIQTGPIIQHKYEAGSIAGAAVEFLITQATTGGRFILEASGTPQSLVFENTLSIPQISSTGFGIALVADKDGVDEETVTWVALPAGASLSSFGNDLGAPGNEWKNLFLSNDLLIGGKMVLGQTSFDYNLSWVNPAADRAISIPDPGGTDEFVFKAMTQVLTNKTFNLTDNTLTGSQAEFDTAVGGTGFMYDLDDDASPQLGGNLDTNSFEIALDAGHKLYFNEQGGDIFLSFAQIFGGQMTFNMGAFVDFFLRNDSIDDGAPHTGAANVRFALPGAATQGQGFQWYENGAFLAANERLRLSTLPHLWMAEAGSTPTAPALAADSGMYFYQKADKVVFAFNDATAGFTRYKSLLLTGTTVTWVDHGSTAP